MITVNLPRNLEERLELLANKSGKTKERCAEETIFEYLQDLEDYFIAQPSQGVPDLPLSS